MKKNMIFRQNKKNVHISILFKSFHSPALNAWFFFWSISERLNQCSNYTVDFGGAHFFSFFFFITGGVARALTMTYKDK